MPSWYGLGVRCNRLLGNGYSRPEEQQEPRYLDVQFGRLFIQNCKHSGFTGV